MRVSGELRRLEVTLSNSKCVRLLRLAQSFARSPAQTVVALPGINRPAKHSGLEPGTRAPRADAKTEPTPRPGGANSNQPSIELAGAGAASAEYTLVDCSAARVEASCNPRDPRADGADAHSGDGGARQGPARTGACHQTRKTSLTLLVLNLLCVDYQLDERPHKDGGQAPTSLSRARFEAWAARENDKLKFRKKLSVDFGLVEVRRKVFLPTPAYLNPPSTRLCVEVRVALTDDRDVARPFEALAATVSCGCLRLATCTCTQSPSARSVD